MEAKTSGDHRQRRRTIPVCEERRSDVGSRRSAQGQRFGVSGTRAGGVDRCQVLALLVLSQVKLLLPEREGTRWEWDNAQEDLDAPPKECWCIKDAVPHLHLLVSLNSGLSSQCVFSLPCHEAPGGKELPPTFHVPEGARGRYGASFGACPCRRVLAATSKTRK